MLVHWLALLPPSKKIQVQIRVKIIRDSFRRNCPGTRNCTEHILLFDDFFHYSILRGIQFKIIRMYPLPLCVEHELMFSRNQFWHLKPT